MRRLTAASGSFGAFRLTIGVAGDLDDALLGDAAAHEHVIGHIGAIRRQPPIVVDARFIGAAIGVSTQFDLARLLGEELADLTDDAHELRLRLHRADREHGEIGVVGEADEQPLRRLRDLDMRAGRAPAFSALVILSIAARVLT